MTPAETQPRAPSILPSGAAAAPDRRGAPREGASGTVALRHPRGWSCGRGACSPGQGHLHAASPEEAREPRAAAPGSTEKEPLAPLPRSLAPPPQSVPESNTAPGIQSALYKCRFIFPIPSLLYA